MHVPHLHRARVDISLGIAILCLVGIFAIAYGVALVNALLQ